MSHDPRAAWLPVQSVVTLKQSAVNNFPHFIRALREVVENEYWREFLFEPTGNTKRFDTLAAFLRWASIEERELIAVLTAHDEAELLARVRAELGGELAESGRWDREGKGSGTTLTEGDRSATYLVARLRRDRPDLAEQVMAGNKTANAAAIEAGFRKRYIRVPAEDVEAAVRRLLKDFTADELIDAVRTIA